MRWTVAIVVVTAIVSSCRNDPGENELEWSCATVQRSGPAVATPECYADLQRTQSPVLNYYKAVVQTAADGRVDHYLLVEKSGRVEPAVASSNEAASPVPQLKLEPGETALRAKTTRDKRN